MATEERSAEAKSAAEAAGKLGAIRELLGRDPVCQEIVGYLHRHTEAMDTAGGIAEWWVKREVRRTEEALLELARHGVVQSFVVGSARFYAYMRSPLLRKRLAQCLGSLGDGSGGGRR